MSAETQLFATLAAASAVTALVSQRIYPDVTPAEATLPCVAYARLETSYVQTIHSAAPVAETAVLEVMCMATSRDGAETLCNAVQAALFAAGFTPVGRRAEFDFDSEMCAAVLTVEKFSNL